MVRSVDDDGAATGGVVLQEGLGCVLDDGKELGPAFTDEAGLATIKPGRKYRGGLRIEFLGAPGTRYFDEALKRDVEFPPGEQLRVHVDRIRGNVGVTPLTEAAVQYAESARVSDRKAANDLVRQQMNQQLPQVYAVDDITRLPELIGPVSGQGALPPSPSGRYGAVIAGLTISASQFNASLPSPGLSIARQLARDLRDGKLNGAGVNGEAVAPAGEAAYEAQDFAGHLSTAVESANATWGTPEQSRAGAPVSGGAFFSSDGQQSARILSNGTVQIPTLDNTILPSNTASPAVALHSEDSPGGGTAMFIRHADGTVEATGFNFFRIVTGNSSLTFYRFAATSPQTTFAPVVVKSLSGPNVATDIAIGSTHAIARLTDGTVVAWGLNFGGQLGFARGPSPGQGESSVDPLPVPGVKEARSVSVSPGSGQVSLALLTDGRVMTWGPGFGDPGNTDGKLDARPYGQNIASADRLPPGSVRLRDETELSGAVAALASPRNSGGVALRADGTVWGWGNAYLGQSEGFAFAVPIAGLSGIRKIAGAGGNGGGFAALDEAGGVKVWGYSSQPEPASNVTARIKDIQYREGRAVAIGFLDEEFIVTLPPECCIPE